MNAGQQHGSARPRWRNLWFLVVLIAVGIAAWATAWFWIASEVDARVDRAFARLDRQGLGLNCDGRAIRGFPFRVGLFCDAMTATHREGMAQFGALRSAAQLYAPGRFVAELDAPVDVRRHGGIDYALDWQAMRASGKVSLDGSFDRLSLLAGEMGLRDAWAGDSEPFATLREGQLHVRISPADPADLDLALSLLDFEPARQLLPGLSVTTDMTLDGLADIIPDLASLPAIVLQDGMAGTLRSLVIEPRDGGRLLLSGPFSLDRQARLSATFEIELQELGRLVGFARRLFPLAREELDRIAVVITTLGASDAGSKLTVEIRNGRISVGPLFLGELPPLL